MKTPARIPEQLALIIATVFGVGYLPGAPGTAGSLCALPLAWVLGRWCGWPAVLLSCLIVFFVGWWASVLAESQFGEHDSCHIVVDEVAGQLLTMIAVPCTWPNLVVGFGFFRLFDSVKPWPAGWIDQKMESGLGVMLDDLAAGVYAGLATAAFFYSGLIDWVIALVH
jgi:phosphatidylglycerophosphatase A